MIYKHFELLVIWYIFPNFFDLLMLLLAQIWITSTFRKINLQGTAVPKNYIDRQNAEALYTTQFLCLKIMVFSRRYLLLNIFVVIRKNRCRREVFLENLLFLEVFSQVIVEKKEAYYKWSICTIARALKLWNFFVFILFKWYPIKAVLFTPPFLRIMWWLANVGRVTQFLAVSGTRTYTYVYM